MKKHEFIFDLELNDAFLGFLRNLTPQIFIFSFAIVCFYRNHEKTSYLMLLLACCFTLVCVFAIFANCRSLLSICKTKNFYSKCIMYFIIVTTSVALPLAAIRAAADIVGKT